MMKQKAATLPFSTKNKAKSKLASILPAGFYLFAFLLSPITTEKVAAQIVPDGTLPNNSISCHAFKLYMCV